MSGDEVLAIGRSEVVVLGPEDRLVVVMKGNPTPADAEAMRARVEERWPGVADRILIVANAESVAVLRAEKPRPPVRTGGAVPRPVVGDQCAICAETDFHLFGCAAGAYRTPPTAESGVSAGPDGRR